MYAIYLRKSRKDIELESLGEGETLARHKRALLEYAEKHDLQIKKIYEEMVSGESISDRPKVQELLEEVHAGKYTGVLVMEIERLARGNTKDQGEVAEAFWNTGTLIVTPSKTYDPTNEFDEEYFEFGLFMSRREYKTIRRRMQRGLMDAIKEGNYVGSLPPYGYDIIRVNKKERTLKFNEQTTNVKMIFEWFVNDRLNPGEIARQLTAMGIPTQTNRPEWNRATIKDILKNNLYTGKIRWNRRKVTKEIIDGQRKKRKHRNTSENYLIVDGKHPAIISQEMFDKAQTLFTGSVPVNAGNKVVNPFARLMYCKTCGKAMAFQGFNKRPTTASRMVHRESALCNVKSAPYEAVMSAVVEELKMQISEFELAISNENELRLAEERKRLLAGMQKELTALKIKREGLFDYLESGIYTKDEFLQRKNVYTERIEKLNSSIETERQKANQTLDYQERILKFSEIVEMLKDPEVEARHKNDLLKEIITRIEYDCIDHGRQKGGEIILDLFFRE